MVAAVGSIHVFLTIGDSGGMMGNKSVTVPQMLLVCLINYKHNKIAQYQ